MIQLSGRGVAQGLVRTLGVVVAEGASRAAAFFARANLMVAVLPLFLLIPAAAVCRIVQKTAVFPIIGFAGVVVFNGEIGIFDDPSNSRGCS